MNDQLTNIIFSPYGMSLLLAFFILIGCGVYAVSGLNQIAMEKRLARLKGVKSVQTLSNEDLSILKESDKLESTIAKFLPSIKGTQVKLRRSGGFLNIRSYLLLVLLLGGALSLFINIPGVPKEGLPLLTILGSHYIIEKFILPMLIGIRQKKILKQIPEMVDYISRGIIVGQSLEVAIRSASEALPAPLGEDMKAITKLTDIGVPLGEALTIVANEIDSAEFDFFVFACNAQLESGGNLSQVLQSLSDTIRARLTLFLEINAMTAEGKMSAIFLACLPLALFGYLLVSNPGYMDPLFTTDLGQIIFYSIFVLIGFGTFVAWKIAKVKP